MRWCDCGVREHETRQPRRTDLGKPIGRYPARQGCLGLAICKEIAIAHEWRLTVSSLISGTKFIVWF